MNKTTIDLRVIQLKAMDDFMHSVNNEELIEEWLTYGIPDEASKDDYYSIAEDDESYKECIKIFKRRRKVKLKYTVNNMFPFSVIGFSKDISYENSKEEIKNFKWDLSEVLLS